MSQEFFQEGIDEAIGLLEESRATNNVEVKTEKLAAAFDLIEKLAGIFVSLKGREEREFAKLVQYTNEFIYSIKNYEITRDKRAIAAEMETLARVIAAQAKKIVSISEELEKLPLKHRLGTILGSMRRLEGDDSSEKKTKEIILEHSLLKWEEKEAQEFSLMINYIDNYIRCLLAARDEVSRNAPAAIEKLRKAGIFGALIMTQAKRLAKLL